MQRLPVCSYLEHRKTLNIPRKTAFCSLQCGLMNQPTKRYWIVILIVPILLVATGQSVQPKSAPPAEADIRHLLAGQVEAWNKGDLEGFMNGYWHSPDLTFFSGTTITQGWEPTLQRYRQRYKGEGKEMGRLEFLDLNVDLLDRNAAVVTGKWQLAMSDGKKPGGLFTLILKKMPVGWRIVHDHTSGG
jgi:ketosteroid isomerase-like protein